MQIFIDMRIKLIAILIIAAMMAVPQAMSQVRLGLKGGIAVNKLHFDKTIINSDNQSGFTGGLQVDISLPVTGLGLDASLLYSHRKDLLNTQEQTYSRDYVEIPIHVKYGITIFGLNKFLVPYAFTGPNFSFLFNESKQDMWDNRASNTAWDVGFGVEFFHRLQVQAAYCIGLTKAFKQVGLKNSDETTTTIQGRDQCWTITAAYLF